MAPPRVGGSGVCGSRLYPAHPRRQDADIPPQPERHTADRRPCARVQATMTLLRRPIGTVTTTEAKSAAGSVPCQRRRTSAAAASRRDRRIARGNDDELRHNAHGNHQRDPGARVPGGKRNADASHDQRIDHRIQDDGAALLPRPSPRARRTRSHRNSAAEPHAKAPEHQKRTAASTICSTPRFSHA